MSIDIVLSRLEGVKNTGTDRWIARCPAHEDRNPSLSIRYDDGKVLLRCFAGCSIDAVLAGTGLRWSDLFPLRLDSSGPVPRHRRPELTAAEVVALLRLPLTVIAIAGEDMAQGKPFTVRDLETLQAAVRDIRLVLDNVESP